MNYKELRRQYKPATIKCLFIAESPPESDDQDPRFFYNANNTKYDIMFLSFMRAIYPKFDSNYKEIGKDGYLC